MLIYLLLCLNSYFLVEANFFTKVEPIDGGINITAFKKSNGNFGCSASYLKTYNSTGWDSFELRTNAEDKGTEQAKCAGILEGIATTEAIYIHYVNTVKNTCKKRKRICKKVRGFLKKHFDWLEDQIEKRSSFDPIWSQVGIIYTHMISMYDGYTYEQTDPKKKLKKEDILWMNFYEDIDDLFDAFDNDTSVKVTGDGRCSALIKILPNNTDLLVGHATWSSYTSMYRMLKKYIMPLNTTESSGQPVATRVISFTGYPGVITSVDDFYTTSTNMVVLETTIGNSNASRWQYINPIDQLLEPVRAMVALRLARNGSSWCNIFSTNNSGTYNNQWMVVDLTKFKKGSSPQDGTLYVLEQIPGYVRYEDQTQRLKSQSYWPSYNVAFYKDVFNLSGNQELVDKYGDWFSYDKTPRALMFGRDHKKVKNYDTMIGLLRYNNYTYDPLSACNCTPPYSAENAIAARSDLNPKDGHYPFPALGHRPHGAIDAKVTSPELVANLTFLAVCGPTFGSGVPPFVWNTSDFNHLPHHGQPNRFDQFVPVLPPWRLT